MEPEAQFAISSMRRWMDFRMPTLLLMMETTQKMLLERISTTSTITRIFMESLFVRSFLKGCIIRHSLSRKAGLRLHPRALADLSRTACPYLPCSAFILALASYIA